MRIAQATGQIESGAVMSMRVNMIVTHLRTEETITLIEFLDQLRDVLMRIYGDEVTAMLQDASQRARSASAPLGPVREPPKLISVLGGLLVGYFLRR
jgi:hypothetical protein